MRARQGAGFTLVEVMIALAILFGALVVLLRGAAANIAATQRSQILTAATELARAKMYDLEATLLEEGYQELNQEHDGDFSEEGWPFITWEAAIVKVELPNLETMQGLGAADGEEGAESEESAGGGMMGGLMGMAGGLGGGGGGIGAGFVGSQFEMFRNILEASIRKVTLTLRWEVAGDGEELAVDCYFTAPAAVNRIIAGGPAYEESEGGEDAGGEDAGGEDPGGVDRSGGGRAGRAGPGGETK